MPADPPIACSLTATELPARLALIGQLGRDALLDSTITATSAALRFSPAGGVRERVNAIVVAESACCAFLKMRVSDAPGAIVLEIDAPDGAELILADLVEAFRGAGGETQLAD